MNQEAILWIFGVLITLLTVVIGAGLSVVFDVKVRVVRLETTMSMFNQKAAEILHSPHTPELDTALENLVKAYRENHDMCHLEWKELLRLTELIENDPTLPKGERLIAALITTTCRVKLEMTPTGYRKTL